MSHYEITPLYYGPTDIKPGFFISSCINLDYGIVSVNYEVTSGEDLKIKIFYDIEDKGDTQNWNNYYEDLLGKNTGEHTSDIDDVDTGITYYFKLYNLRGTDETYSDTYILTTYSLNNKKIILGVDDIYVINNRGLDVYNKTTNELKFTIADVNDISENTDNIFLATSSGINTFMKSDTNYNIVDYASINTIISNVNVNKISFTDNYSCAVLDDSMYHFSLTDRSYNHSFYNSNDIDKCLQTDKGVFYYTNLSGTEIYRVDNYKCDWETYNYKIPNEVITLNSGIINNFYKEDYLYLATTSGLYIVDDNTNSYTILLDNFESTSADFISIEIKDSKICTATKKCFYVINSTTKIIEDYYTSTHKGKNNEYLLDEDIIDSDV